VKKQHKLENSSNFIVIEEKLKKLSFKLKENAVTRDYHYKKLYAQKRKLISVKLYKCQQLQLRKVFFKMQKMKQIEHHCT